MPFVCEIRTHERQKDFSLKYLRENVLNMKTTTYNFW